MKLSFPIGVSLVIGLSLLIVGTVSFFISTGIAHGDQSQFVLHTLSQHASGAVASAVTYRDGGDGGSSSGGDAGGTGGDAGGAIDIPPPAPLQPACTMSNSVSGAVATLSWNSSDAISAFLDRGIGAVGVNGFLTVSPTVTTTYLLTVSGSGGTATCSTTVVVIPPPAKPSCSISSAVSGTKFNLTWTSSNATSASLNQGIGAVAPSGTLLVAPSVTTAYTLTVTGAGGTATCSTTVVVTPPQNPSCTLTVTPATIQEGQQAILAWTSANAVSAMLSGEAGSVALNGSFAVNPKVSTGYAITVKNSAGVSVRCEASITVVPKAVTPSCSIYANPASIQNGGNSNLTWTSSNATSASLSEGIGAVATNGSKSVAPTYTTTYTLTISGNGGTAQCSTTVTVTSAPPPPQGPSCTFTVTPSTIHDGEQSVLAWTSANAVSAMLSGEAGSVALSGSFAVHPSVSTTYGFTVKNAAGVSKYCETSITVIPQNNPLSCTISAYPGSIAQGESTVITWSTVGATSANLSSVGVVAISGNKTFSPLSNTTYVLTIGDNSGHTASCNTTVTVGTGDPVNPGDKPVMHCYLPADMRPNTIEEHDMLRNYMNQNFKSYITYMNTHGYSWNVDSEVTVEND